MLLDIAFGSRLVTWMFSGDLLGEPTVNVCHSC